MHVYVLGIINSFRKTQNRSFNIYFTQQNLFIKQFQNYKYKVIKINILIWMSLIQLSTNENYESIFKYFLILKFFK